MGLKDIFIEFFSKHFKCVSHLATSHSLVSVRMCVCYSLYIYCNWSSIQISKCHLIQNKIRYTNLLNFIPSEHKATFEWLSLEKDAFCSQVVIFILDGLGEIRIHCKIMYLNYLQIVCSIRAKGSIL